MAPTPPKRTPGFPPNREQRPPRDESDRGGPLAELKAKITGYQPLSNMPHREFSDERGLADRLAQELKGFDNTKATQIRKIFDEIKAIRRSIESKLKRGEIKESDPFERPPELLRLMPALAFATGRKLIAPPFYEILRHCLGEPQLKTYQDFLRAADFIEAVLAFHKYRSLERKGENP